MKSTTASPRKIVRKSARGQAIIESTVSIIIFTMLLATVVSFCAYLYFQQAMVTVAREGARQASLTTGLEDDTSGVITYIQDEMRQLTGQTFDDANGDIIVTGPQPSANNPDVDVVTVTISYEVPNPIGIGAFMDTLGANGDAFRTIPVAASATMRYED